MLLPSRPLPRGRGHVKLCPLRRRSRGERAPVKLGVLCPHSGRERESCTLCHCAPRLEDDAVADLYCQAGRSIAMRQRNFAYIITVDKTDELLLRRRLIGLDKG